MCMDRNTWNAAYTTQMIAVTGCGTEFAQCSAEAADDYYREGYSPVEAADEEISYWDNEKGFDYDRN